MILDDGICTIFRRTDVSAPGGKPVFEYQPIYQSWYKRLSYETTPTWQTPGRQENRVDARIRILQYPGLQDEDVCVLAMVSGSLPAGTVIYRITRAFHGMDDDNRPVPISDLSLEVMDP